MPTADPDGRRIINLALQGGGTHGAFTWGVLDRLLEDERIVIEGISGTSAGAMNGALLALGYHRGGPAAARAALDHFWQRTSELGRFGPVKRGWFERMAGTWNLDRTPAAFLLDQTGIFLSPYQTNPLNLSPIRDLLAETIDFGELRGGSAVKLFVAATNVRTGKSRIFDGTELSIEVLLASACVPQFFHAVEIDGDPYWDGGYMGNPSLLPLIYGCQSRDIVIVEVTPMVRDEVPRSAAEIVSRVNEITFNASLIRELRTLAFVAQLVARGQASGPEIDRLGSVNVHLVEADRAMDALGVVSQLNTELEFLLYLKELGRGRAARWLDENFALLNRRSSVDIVGRFL